MAKTRGARSFGSIRKLPSGRHQARYTGPDGRSHKAHATFTARIDAEGWLAAERRLIELQAWTPPADRGRDHDMPLLRDYAQDWLGSRDLRPRTRDLYSSLLRLHIVPALGDVPLDKITPAAVRSWYARLGSEYPSRRAKSYALLLSIMGTALEDELIAANPCRIKGGSHAPRRKTITVLTAAQIDAVADGMPAAWRMSVPLAAWCSLRLGELLELRRRDLDLNTAALRVERAVTYRAGGEYTVTTPKTEAGVRVVAVPPHLIDGLREHVEQHSVSGADGLLFADDEGGWIAPHTYRKRFGQAARNAGVPGVTPHVLRHSGAVLAARAGATVKELMSRLGHTTPQMSMVYQHTAEGRDAQIAAQLSELAEHGK